MKKLFTIIAAVLASACMFAADPSSTLDVKTAAGTDEYVSYNLVGSTTDLPTYIGYNSAGAGSATSFMDNTSRWKLNSSRTISFKVQNCDSVSINCYFTKDAQTYLKYKIGSGDATNFLTNGTDKKCEKVGGFKTGDSDEILITLSATNDILLGVIKFFPATGSTPTYKVTYKANNGTEEADIVDNEAKKIADCTFTAPAGKTFDGWNTDANGEGTTYEVNAKVTSDLTLYAQWADLFTVTFNLQGHGDAIDAQAIKKGEKVVKPTDPFTVEDFVFDGWYKEAACENEWDFANDVVNANTELFANWKAACFEIIYDFKGGIGSAEVTTAGAGITADSLTLSSTAGRITLTPKVGSQFKNGDVIIFSGEVGNSSKKYGIKIGSQTIQTANVIPNNPEVPTAGGTAKAYGALSLSEDAATIAIGRADGTTTKLTTCIIRREVKCEVTAIDNAEDGQKAVKFFENGQIFIKKNGVVYNAQGAVVR